MPGAAFPHPRIALTAVDRGTPFVRTQAGANTADGPGTESAGLHGAELLMERGCRDLVPVIRLSGCVANISGSPVVFTGVPCLNSLTATS